MNEGPFTVRWTNNVPGARDGHWAVYDSAPASTVEAAREFVRSLRRNPQFTEITIRDRNETEIPINP